MARRVARALDISHCSVILARPGDEFGLVATSYENPPLRNLQINLDRYPEVRAALDGGSPMLIEDLRTSPLYDRIRAIWLREGISVADPLGDRAAVHDRPRARRVYSFCGAPVRSRHSRAKTSSSPIR